VVLLSWMPAYVFRKFGLNLALSGLTATIFVQLASLAGSVAGGWLADAFRRRHAGGRIFVQAAGVLGAAPFVYWCGQTASLPALIVALTVWGFFKGLYDANIFASMFDVLRPEARGSAAGFMNMIGWLGGGGTAPIVVGWIAERSSLGEAISLTCAVYVLGGVLLLGAARWFVAGDAARMQRELAAA
jgi:sugar phosphate permease